MKRWLLTVIAALSVLICGLLLAVHLRGRSAADYLWYNGQGRSLGLFCSQGHLHLTLRSWDQPVPTSLFRPTWEIFVSRPKEDLFALLRQYQTIIGNETLGFAYAYSHDATRSHDAIIPLWALELPAALLSILLIRSALHSHRRHRRLSLGQCLACGYDLRASPGRCPECGTSAPAESMPENVAVPERN